MSLSYAIAFAILLLMESARSGIPLIQQFHERYLDPSKDAADKVVISHMALIGGCAAPLWITNIVSSINTECRIIIQLWGVLSLGIGDAMGAVVGVHCGRTKWSCHSSRTLAGSIAMWTSLVLSCLVVQFWIKLGVAVQPTLPSAQPSLILLCVISFVTLLEAFTFQIDNMVLPLAGTALLLVLFEKEGIS
jgi:dolichol kinase